MKTLIRFLSVLLCIAPFGVANAVVSSTAGSNLTAYNGESGATNNNRWNAAMNSRTGGGGGTNATADFGNCNAVVMRCAQPKCANGGCTDLMVTSSIVSGCVQSSAQCKQYGDELVQYISAQLVASSTAKANASAAAAQTAAANAAAQQSAQQMAQMQQQMQQMQAQMAAQNAETVAQLQNALAEQKQMTANAIAEATTARESTTTTTSAQTSNNDLSGAQISAAERGVSADILAREQISGQIMSSIENAEVQLKTLKATMKTAFDYAGCDSRGNNCSGPKRVKAFKQKAEEFFEPYETVLDELYDALVLAQSVGVDITDIYMMLNGSCNVWGQYLCNLGKTKVEVNGDCVKWEETTENKDGKTVTTKKCAEYSKKTATQAQTLATYNENNCKNNRSQPDGRVRGGHDCAPNQVVPPEDDMMCTLNKTIVDDPNNPVQRDWLWAESDEDGMNIRVGCASNALESSVLFRNRKKQAKIDIETLEKIIAQDAPTTISKYRKNNIDENTERTKYCMVGDKSYTSLQKWVATKGLPTKVCMDEKSALRQLSQEGMLTVDGERMRKRQAAAEDHDLCTEKSGYTGDMTEVTSKPDGGWNALVEKGDANKTKECAPVDAILCMEYAGGTRWTKAEGCVCGTGKKYRESYVECMTDVDFCAKGKSMLIPRSNGQCYDSCSDYCTKWEASAGKKACRISDTVTEIDRSKTCRAEWVESENICKCEAK